MSPQPSEPVAESLLLFNAASPGTYPQSRDAVYRDSRNAVIVEAWPDGTPNPSADVTIIDSELHGGGFNPGVDGAAVKVGLTGYTKWVVPSVLSWVRARLVNTTGHWSVRVSPVNVPNAQNVAVTATSNQGNPNAGGADAWPVTVTDFPATQPISAAALPLPAGAAAAAQLPASLGQKAMAGSTSVTLANDQPALPISAAALPLPAGAATAAKQPALGPAAMAASTPVTLATDQPAVPISQAAATHAKARNLGAVVAIKAAAGTLYGLQVVNSQAATAFVQIFDLAAGGVVLGTTMPDLEIEVAANSTVALALPPAGIAFATAISAASTTTEGGAVTSAAGVQLFAQYA